MTRAQVQLLQHTDGQILLEFEFPEIHLEQDSVTGQITSIDMAGANPIHEVGVPRLPSMCQLLDCLPGQVSVHVEDISAENRQLGPMAPLPEDIPIDERPTNEDAERNGRGFDQLPPRSSVRERSAQTPRKPGIWPPEVVQIREGGTFRGHRLMSLQVFPVQVDAEHGTARVVRRLRIRVTLPRAETAANRLADRPSETEALRRLLGPLAPTALPSRMTEAFEGHGATGRFDDPVGGRWKFFVKTEGIYRVTAQALRDAGCPVEQITTNDAHLKNHGREIPIHFAGEADGRFDEHDYIEFYGIPNRQTYASYSPSFYQDPWTMENVYWLSWGDGRPGLRLGAEQGYHPEWPRSQVRTMSAVRSRMHFEYDSFFDRLSRSYRQWTTVLQTRGPLGIYEDHWFWGDYVNGLTSEDYEVFVPFPDTRSLRRVMVRASMTGYTWNTGLANDTLAGQHRAVVYLNGNTAPGLAAGKVTATDRQNLRWADQQAIIVQTNPRDSVGIIMSSLLDGSNFYRVSLPGDGVAGANDKVFVNWFELEYDRIPRATGGFVSFVFDTTRADTFHFDMRGFASRNISVWKLGSSRLTNVDTRWVTPADEGASWAARFHLVSDGAYAVIVFDDSYARAPEAILPETSTRDLRTMTGAEYLLIYHDNFANELSIQRLDSLRRASFNGSADTIRLSQIYEQFNDGIANPEAIQRFLQYAYEHWTVRPTHACLVGDGVLETKLRREPGDLIPSLYPATLDFGIAASDVLFGCVSGPPWDIIPDVAIGRISCRTATELDTYVEKLISYEDPNQINYQTPFHSTFLFVADENDGQFNFVTVFSERTIQRLTPAVNLMRVYLDSIPPAQGFNRLRDALRQGAVVVNYNGHGGGGVWAGINLLDVPRCRLLSNARSLSFISNFTCYVGAFDLRNQQDGLGEAFLYSRNAISGDPVGAIGVYSSTGVGWAYGGVEMQAHLFDFIAQPPGLTLGQIVQFNKTRFWDAQITLGLSFSNIYSMMMMMSLLGDPGLRLAIPQDTFATFAPDSQIVGLGDTVRIRGTLPWTPSATRTDLYVTPYNGDYYYYWVQEVESVQVITPIFVHTSVPAFDPELVLPIPVRDQQFDVPVTFSSRTSWNRLITPQGKVVVYAVDQGLRRDAIGAFSVFLIDSLSEARVTEVRAYPRGAILNDSTFQIQCLAMHRDGVARVYCRGIFTPPRGPVVLDTVDMVSLGSGYWRTPELGPHHVINGSYRARFFITPHGGEPFASSDFNIYLETYADFGIYSYSGLVPEIRPRPTPTYVIPVGHIRPLYSSHPLELTLTVTAIGDSFRMQTRPNRPDTLMIVPGVDTLRAIAAIANPLDRLSPFEMAAPFAARPLRYRVTVKLDPDNRIHESNENNNTYTATLDLPKLYAASNLQGTYYERPLITEAFHRFWKNYVADTVWFRLPVNSLLTDSASMLYGGPDSLSSSELSGLSQLGLLAPVSGRAVRTFRIALGDSSPYLATGAQGEVMRNFTTTVTNVLFVDAVSQTQVFRRRDESGTWLRLSNPQHVIDDVDTTLTTRTIPGNPPRVVVDTTYTIKGRVLGQTSRLGQFAVFRFIDVRPPEIEVAVDGLRFTSGSFIPRRPQIYVNLTDFSGIDRRPGLFSIHLDNDSIPFSQIAWSDTLEQGGRVTAVIRPELASGHHVLRVRATDNAGLSDSASVDFNVRGDFGIEWAMNYPNPFSKVTTISYLLTDVTDDFVVLKIYTVAGRHIRTIRELDRAVANYRTMVWDGLDEKGEEVANGVYFARVIAKRGDDEVETTVKVAKLR